VGNFAPRTLKDRGEDSVDDLSEYRLAARDEDLTPNFYLPSTPRPAM
jgi:citronellol/citronellal dehydrogenase